MSTDVIDGAIRVSKLGGRIVSADSTLTLTDQQRGLEQAVATAAHLTGRPLRLGKVVQLLDQSGFTAAGGEALGELLERTEQGLNGGVVFAYQSRNGRNWWEQGPFFKRLQNANGLYLIRGLEGIDYRSPQGRQMFGMQAVQDEGVYWQAKDNAERTKDTMMAERKYNRVPYGLQRNGTYVDGACVMKIDPERDGKALAKGEHADVVERIFVMRDQDFGPGAIAGTLNREGIPGPRGGRWVLQTVAEMLKNPIYKGLIVYGRKNPKREPGVRADVRRVSDPAIAIVSVSLWQRVQDKPKTGKKMQRTGTNRAGVAGGVVVCESCGRRLQVQNVGKGRLVYGCPPSSDVQPACPRRVRVKKQAADEYVADLMRERLTGHKPGKAIINARRVDEAKQAVKDAKVDLDALDDVRPSHPKFAEWSERYGQAYDNAVAELESAEAEADADATLPGDVAAWDSMSPIEQNQAARRLLRVIVAPALSSGPLANITERFTSDWQ